MSPVPLTFSQIKAQVAAIRKKKDVGIVGIQTTDKWAGTNQLQDGDDIYRIHQCDSPLAVRLALRQREPEVTVQVILTALEEADLGTDILLRLAKRKLHPINRWAIVKSLFDATTIDPRLTQHPCIADYLIEWRPVQGYPAAIGGFLDAEIAWSILLKECLGLISDRLDLLSLLQWSTIPDHVQRYQQAPPDFQAALLDWLTQTMGAIAPAIIGCGNAQHAESSDAIAVGVVLDILFNPEATGSVIDRAIGKLEANYLSPGSQLQPLAHIWSHSALEILRLKITDSQQQRQIIDRADTILKNLGVDGLAYHSDVSAIGYAQRLTQFAESIIAVINDPQYAILQKMEHDFNLLKQHETAKQTQEVSGQCLMALRLCRWLVERQNQASTPIRSLDEAVLSELQQGGFIDWARLKLPVGHHHRPLAEAMKTLFEVVTKWREQQAQRFAQLLQSWTELGSNANVFIPIEQILAEIVAPLVDRSPVLVIVMDGMSTAACHELITDITKNNDWSRIVPQNYPASLMAGLAAIPSITTVSRTSLLCGQLKSGIKHDEVKGFATHPQLYPRCRSGSPPILFHKDAFRTTAGEVIGDEVRTTLASSQHRVVGVVINAIDDNLKQGDQIQVNWSLNSLPILSTLLSEAQAANRIVIILSDHGHVIECNSTYQAKLVQGQAGGERWHSNLDNITEGELVLKGDRVVIPNTHQIVVPWSERLRYAKNANGHHGGINPQEMVIPIAILHPANPPANWQDAPVDQPTWWNTTPAPSAISFSPSAISEASELDYGPLFTAPAAAVKSSSHGLIQALLESPIYHIQQKKAGKNALDNETIFKIISELEKHDYAIHLVTLAKLLNVSSKKMQSHLLKLQRTLNIDGYQILIYDAISMHVKLIVTSLCDQFAL